MKIPITTHEPQRTAGLPEFLDALDRAYQYFGLTAEEAQAATFADAETFAPAPGTPEFTT